MCDFWYKTLGRDNSSITAVFPPRNTSLSSQEKTCKLFNICSDLKAAQPDIWYAFWSEHH